ncbi:unnamed protein product [Symbiodinium sp. CCMP2592]|nr:unnamed protein product [Symbiodinium sp. CCMP2592]
MDEGCDSHLRNDEAAAPFLGCDDCNDADVFVLRRPEVIDAKAVKYLKKLQKLPALQELATWLLPEEDDSDEQEQEELRDLLPEEEELLLEPADGRVVPPPAICASGGFGEDKSRPLPGSTVRSH